VKGSVVKSVIVGYSDRDSVRPGDSIAFKVSCENAPTYRADIVRLHCPDTSPEGPGYRETEVPSVVNGTYPARVQSINIGSYIRIGNAGIISTLSSFTVVLAVWPTTPGRGSQALIGNWDPGQGNGWGLLLDGNGALAFQCASRSNRVN
jgi:N,N-dimethylformamidase